MSHFKLLLLLSSSLSFHLGLVRPESPDAEDKIMVTTLRERIWQQAGVPAEIFLKVSLLPSNPCANKILTRRIKTVTWLATAGESMVILGALRNAPWPSGTLLDLLGPAEASQLTVPFVVGASLVIIGGYARVVSSRALGPLFTFVQCLRKEHKLVTGGPYAIVRHPGYSGLLLCIIGWGIMHGTPGSWLRLSGMLDVTWVRVILAPTCLLLLACIVTVFRRSADEDRYLSQRFGEEWKNWARRVRYQLIPFVY